MLTRKCVIEKLLKEDDFNVRVTAFQASRISGDPKLQKSAWLETIRDALGGGIVNTNLQHSVQLEDENGTIVGTGVVAGKNIAKVIDAVCETPIPIRITIKSCESLNDRVWIIA